MVVRVEFNAQGAIMLQIYLGCPGNQLRILGFRVSVSLHLRDLLVGLLSLNLLLKSGKFVRVISISRHVTV